MRNDKGAPNFRSVPPSTMVTRGFAGRMGIKPLSNRNIAQKILAAGKSCMFMGTAIAGMTASCEAQAYTECTVRILRVYVGDGTVWLDYTNGGSGYLASTDPDREGTLAAATTALVAQREMIVRNAADGVACTATARADLIGVYLT